MTAANRPACTAENPLGARLMLRADGTVIDRGIGSDQASYHLLGGLIWPEAIANPATGGTAWIRNTLARDGGEILVAHELLTYHDGEIRPTYHVLINTPIDKTRRIRRHLWAASIGQPSNFKATIKRSHLEQMWAAGGDTPQHTYHKHQQWHRLLADAERPHPKIACPLQTLSQLVDETHARTQHTPNYETRLDWPEGRLEVARAALRAWPHGGHEEPRRHLAATLLGEYSGDHLIRQVDGILD